LSQENLIRALKNKGISDCIILFGGHEAKLTFINSNSLMILFEDKEFCLEEFANHIHIEKNGGKSLKRENICKIYFFAFTNIEEIMNGETLISRFLCQEKNSIAEVNREKKRSIDNTEEGSYKQFKKIKNDNRTIEKCSIDHSKEDNNYCEMWFAIKNFKIVRYSELIEAILKYSTSKHGNLPVFKTFSLYLELIMRREQIINENFEVHVHHFATKVLKNLLFDDYIDNFIKEMTKN
jgi:hypothetical protein